MIFADKLIALRKQSGWSQEELAEKLNVSRQSISKWEGAQSVPDLDKIILLSRVFEVSTDYLLRDEVEMASNKDHYEPTTIRTVSMEEANEFLAKSKKAGLRNAIGVALCIVSPITLIFLSVLSEQGGIAKGVGIGIGIAVLLVMVAIAVAIFIFTNATMEEYEFLTTDEFKVAFGVQGLAQDLLKKGKSNHVIAISIGVVLCILSPVPLIIMSIMSAQSLMIVAMVDVLLVLVAGAVFIFIASSSQKAACDKLLQRGEYSADEKYVSKRMGVVAGVYWPLVTAIYLGLSFIIFRWDMTWIIWPVAGVSFAVISVIAKSVFLSKRNR